jgi:hypothetical protein
MIAVAAVAAMLLVTVAWYVRILPVSPSLSEARRPLVSYKRDVSQ